MNMKKIGVINVPQQVRAQGVIDTLIAKIKMIKY